MLNFLELSTPLIVWDTATFSLVTDLIISLTLLLEVTTSALHVHTVTCAGLIAFINVSFREIPHSIAVCKTLYTWSTLQVKEYDGCLAFGQLTTRCPILHTWNRNLTPLVLPMAAEHLVSRWLASLLSQNYRSLLSCRLLWFLLLIQILLNAFSALYNFFSSSKSSANSSLSYTDITPIQILSNLLSLCVSVLLRWPYYLCPAGRWLRW